MFLPHGEQWGFISKHENKYLWTLIVTDLDDDTLWEITSGVHTVNRQGYLVTELPYSEDVSIIY